jgi:VWFA-related protein
MKKLQIILRPSLLFFASISVYSQQASPTPPTPPVDDSPVRISTALIQLDAVVTDKDGHIVSGLHPEDFKVYQDGKLQTISSLSFVDRSSVKSPISSSKGAQKEVPPPPSQANGAGRIITFLIDDGNCLATFDGMRNISDSMKKFIVEQMLPDDRVAIYRTKGGSSLLQTYTNNKSILLQKISKLSRLPDGTCATSFDSSIDNGSNPRVAQLGTERDRLDPGKEAERTRRERNVIGTVDILNFVVNRLKPVRQRKMIFLLSEGLVVSNGSRAIDALRDVVDNAARASVVINTFSSKGLMDPGFISAADNVSSDGTAALSSSRIQEARELDQGLNYLASSTGGVFVRNKNSFEKDIKRLLDLQTAYYLISYEPAGETFKGKNFHKIEIQMANPELKAVSRSGFYGREDAPVVAATADPDSPLYQALKSPFQDNGMDIALTMFRGNSPQIGEYVRPILHLSGQDITFVDDADKGKKMVFDVVAVVLDERGKPIDEFNHTYTIHVPAAGVELALKNGVDFSTDFAIKKSGIYSIRVAIRDNASHRLGAASDMVEIPDQKKDDLRVLGLLTTFGGPNGQPVFPDAPPVSSKFSVVLTPSAPSVRQYSIGSQLHYIYTVYNAKPNAAAPPTLVRRIRLYKDGKMILETPETPLDLTSTSDLLRIEDHGTIGISNSVEIGQYTLQVIVREQNSTRTSSQWIDFEVIP